MNSYAEISQIQTGISPIVQEKMLISLGVVLVLWVLRAVILRIVWKRTDEARLRYIWRKSLTYVVVILSFFIVIPVWIKDLKSVATFWDLHRQELQSP